VLNLAVFLAQIIAMTAAGALIDSVGYFAFFYALGAIVIVAGLVAGSLLQDAPLLEGTGAPASSFLSEFASLFQWDTVRRNRGLFILLLFIIWTLDNSD
jgi:hypothetical protein